MRPPHPASVPVLARRLTIRICKLIVAALKRRAAGVHVDLPSTKPLSGSLAESWQTHLGAGRENGAPSIVKDSQSDRLGLVRQRNPAS